MTWFQCATRLGMYRAADGEINLQPLLALAWSLGKEVYLPAIAAPGQMHFRRFRPGDKLHANRYGIREPSRSAPAIKASELDAIFVPMVAFTEKGYRLGMGGGYYDRALAAVERKSNNRYGATTGGIPGLATTRLIGVAHSCQRVGSLPLEPWDIPMDMIVTEAGPVAP
jgi:5-formyltetrahydrofolate cyclo-ligase